MATSIISLINIKYILCLLCTMYVCILYILRSPLIIQKYVEISSNVTYVVELMSNRIDHLISRPNRYHFYFENVQMT